MDCKTPAFVSTKPSEECDLRDTTKKGFLMLGNPPSMVSLDLRQPTDGNVWVFRADTLLWVYHFIPVWNTEGRKGESLVCTAF